MSACVPNSIGRLIGVRQHCYMSSVSSVSGGEVCNLLQFSVFTAVNNPVAPVTHDLSVYVLMFEASVCLYLMIVK